MCHFAPSYVPGESLLVNELDSVRGFGPAALEGDVSHFVDKMRLLLVGAQVEDGFGGVTKRDETNSSLCVADVKQTDEVTHER